MRSKLCKFKGLQWGLLVFALACVSKSKAPEPVPAEGFCQAFAKTACSWQERCSPTSQPEKCEKSYRTPCDEMLTFRVLRDMEYGIYIYDPQVAATWLSTLNQLSCESDEVVLAPDSLFQRNAEKEWLLQQ